MRLLVVPSERERRYRRRARSQQRLGELGGVAGLMADLDRAATYGIEILGPPPTLD